MSNQKSKAESYAQLGGINSKSSPYITDQMEVLDLSNFDFQTPGSWTERWGSTQYIGQTFPGSVNALSEFTRLDGSSYVLAGYSGGIFYGATTGANHGISFTLQSVTLSAYFYPTRIAGLGNTPQIFTRNPMGVAALGSQDFVLDSTYQNSPSAFNINPVLQLDNTLSTATFQNYLFMADGNKFVKFDGITTTPVGLPPPLLPFGSSNINGTGPDIGISMFYSALGGASIGLSAGGNFYGVYASFVNNRGFEGPIWPLSVVTLQMDGATASAVGGSFVSLSFAIATPLAYGISAINCYVYATGTTVGFPISSPTALDTDFWSNYDYRLTGTTPASGSTITWMPVGVANGLAATMIGNYPLPNTITKTYLPLGLTFVTTKNVVQETDLPSFYPRYLEVFSNRLFLAGFSAMPSSVYFSDVSEPEGYAPDFNFEVRTNDGDYITCLRSYSTRLYIFKKKSFHALGGDNPNNFAIQEITDQYGCLNNRSAVIYDDILLFLDQKGVIMWNGSGLTVLSNKVQPIFDRMNFSVALNTACMTHDKIRNQILVSIPVDGSSINNLIVVYDYLVGAWTHYDGIGASSLRSIQGRNNTKNAFYGSYSGTINWFGPSFLNDNGIGFTTYVKTHFLKGQGDSTQKMFRRLYLNADSSDTSFNLKINFFQDYGSSIVYSSAMSLQQFQNRIDFGISGKSLAFEMSNIQSSSRLKLHGFTIESRFLRGT